MNLMINGERDGGASDRICQNENEIEYGNNNNNRAHPHTSEIDYLSKEKGWSRLHLQMNESNYAI